MSKQTAPVDLLAPVRIAGNPYHGLVEGGVLTLPNAATMAHPQPDGGQWYMSGRSIVVQRPGWTAPERTASEQAADAADGKQWLPYSIIAGESALFYGKPLGQSTWIYIDPAGDRWLSSLVLPPGETVGTSQGNPVTVRLARFGDFSSSAEVHEHAVTMPSLGQDAPTWAGFGDPDQMSHRLMDVRPDGSGALFMAYISPAWAAGYVQDVALAFFEVTISGAGDAATVGIYLRRNRAQCVGTVVSDNPYPSFAIGFGNDSTLPADLPSVKQYLLSVNDWYDRSADLSTCTGANKAHGVVLAHRTIQTDGVETPAPPAGYSVLNEITGLHEDDQEYALDRRDVILSAYYGPSGDIRELGADIVAAWEADHSPVEHKSGSTAVREAQTTGSPGSCSMNETVNSAGSITITKTNSIRGRLAITLKSNGATVAARSWWGRRTLSRTETIEYRARFSATIDMEFRASRSFTTTTEYDAGAGVQTITDTQTAQSLGWPSYSTGAYTYASAGPDVRDIRQPWFLRRQFTFENANGGQVQLSVPVSVYSVLSTLMGSFSELGEPAIRPGGISARAFVSLARLAPAVVTVMESDKGPLTADIWTATFTSPLATPSGPVTITPVSVDTGSNVSPFPPSPLRASYHPVTGEVAMSFSPVCWV